MKGHDCLTATLTIDHTDHTTAGPLAVYTMDEDGPPDEAMRRLVVRSQHENVKLREVAARFVREVL